MRDDDDDADADADADARRAARTRREPPRFRHVEVHRVERLTPRMARIGLVGEQLVGLTVEEPAASVRLLLPPHDSRELVMPRWNGNEFLLPDGRRPTIRTFTPLRVDPDTGRLDVEVVLHPGGAASSWAEAAEAGAPAAVSGPGRGYTVDVDAPAHLLVGDETAIPAVGQLLESLPAEARVQVHLEVARPDARMELPAHPRAVVTWWDLPPDDSPGARLLEAVEQADIPADGRVWAAGEAAAMHRLRRHLSEERGVGRGQATVRGYWKTGR